MRNKAFRSMNTKHGGRFLAAVLVCCGMAAVMAGCSNIDEAERLVPVEPVVPVDTTKVDPNADLDSYYNQPVEPVARRILIEDHTGQRCANCPDAATVIHDLQAVYGNIIVPVAIHSAEQGIMEPEGLGTELGNTYYRHWDIGYKPAGLISRMDGGAGVVMDKTIWAMAVEYIAALESPLDIRMKAVRNAADPTKVDIDVKVVCTREEQSAEGKLQVWVTEDSIVAPQDYLNGVHFADYQHDHVLRAAVNGDWGEPVSVNGLADAKEFHYTLTLSPDWNPAHLAIVAFVYNDGEVIQVVRSQLRSSQLPKKSQKSQWPQKPQ